MAIQVTQEQYQQSLPYKLPQHVVDSISKLKDERAAKGLNTTWETLIPILGSKYPQFKNSGKSIEDMQNLEWQEQYVLKSKMQPNPQQTIQYKKEGSKVENNDKSILEKYFDFIDRLEGRTPEEKFIRQKFLGEPTNAEKAAQLKADAKKELHDIITFQDLRNLYHTVTDSVPAYKSTIDYLKFFK